MNNIELTSSGYIKLLATPDMVYGYFTGRYKSLTDEQAKKIVQKKMDDLYNAVCEDWYDGDIEVTFYDKECHDWWENLIENTKAVLEYNTEGWRNGVYSHDKVPTGNWLIEIPYPPKYIFEKT